MTNPLSEDQRNFVKWSLLSIGMISVAFLAIGIVFSAIKVMANAVNRPAPATVVSTSTAEILYTRCSKVDRETVGLVGTDLIALDSKDDTLCVLNRDFKFEVAVPGQPVQVPVQATTTKP